MIWITAERRDIMRAIEAIHSRVSVRKYKDEIVGKELLLTLVDAGRRAPSARAVEPWEFVVIQDTETLSRLSEITSPNGSFIADAAASIIVLSSETKYYLEDSVAATENILIAAADAGLGACWIAGDKKDYCPEIINLLKAPADLRLVSIISIGWPAQENVQSKKRALEQVIHWERY